MTGHNVRQSLTSTSYLRRNTVHEHSIATHWGFYYLRLVCMKCWKGGSHVHRTPTPEYSSPQKRRKKSGSIIKLESEGRGLELESIKSHSKSGLKLKTNSSFKPSIVL